MMLSSGALRGHIASVIDALSKAAVAEISKFVEDGMVVLRLEMCQRENEIRKLKNNMEVLHRELTATQRATAAAVVVTPRPEQHEPGGHEQSQSDAVVKVKVEPEEPEETSTSTNQPEEASMFEGGQWRATTQNDNTHEHNPDYLSQTPVSGLVPESPSGGGSGLCGRGLLGFGPFRNSTTYNLVRRRTVKRLMFHKGFMCPYCGKCFERSGHLERHKRIHTGEKPYRCEMCGRRFSQKCSLKEHMKIHRRALLSSSCEVPLGEQTQTQVVDVVDPRPPQEEKNQEQVEDVVQVQTEDLLPEPVQVKSEPAEEEITPTPLMFHGGNEHQAVEPGHPHHSEALSGFERDGQTWMSRLQTNPEMSGAEFLSHNVTSFPGITPLLPPPPPPPPAEPSCSTFPFPGKPYEDLQNHMMSQTPYGSSSETLMIPPETSLHSLTDSMRRTWGSFQAMKPKKCFICSYCGKVFERSGHLDRHLRIHTGEKPYGCHICGRCFNQKSSLKGHMKTHRNGENPDMQDTNHLLLTLSNHQPAPLENQQVEEPKTSRTSSSLEDQIPVPTFKETLREEGVVKVKVEDFQPLNQEGAGASDQMWTSGEEKSGDVISQDVRFHPPSANEQQGFTATTNQLPFLNHKDKDDMMMMHNNQYPGQPMICDVTQEVVVSDYHTTTTTTTSMNHNGGVFEFSMIPSDHQENRYICANCGENFDNFNLFQMHQCEEVTEISSYSCQVCGKSFNHKGLLKLHLKIHGE